MVYDAASASGGTKSRRRPYVAGAVGASTAYVFVVLAFTGRFDRFEWSAFMAVLLAAFYGFDRFVERSERFDRSPAAGGTRSSFTTVAGTVSY